MEVALLRWIARGDALPTHHGRYSHNRPVELPSVKSVCLDNHLLPDRNFVYVSFVYFRLNMSRGSISEAEQCVWSDGAVGLAASGIDPQNGSVDRSQDGALPDALLDHSNAALRREHLGIRARPFFLQRRRGQQLLGSNGGLEVGI